MHSERALPGRIVRDKYVQWVSAADALHHWVRVGQAGLRSKHRVRRSDRSVPFGLVPVDGVHTGRLHDADGVPEHKLTEGVRPGGLLPVPVSELLQACSGNLFMRDRSSQ